MSKADDCTTPIRSRRAVLTAIAAAAALPIAAALPVAAPAFAGTTDPIFAALDAYNRAWVDLLSDKDNSREVAARCRAAEHALVRTQPATPAGLAALTTWARKEADEMCDNSHWNSETLCALSATIDDATRGMSGLEPWSPPSAMAAPSTPDPVYGVIERHQRLSIAYDKAVNHPDVGDNRPQFAAVNEISSQACSALLDHANMMFTFQPATPTGVAALLRYIATLEDWEMPCGMGEPDEIASLKTLCSTMANALDPSREAAA